MEEGTSGELEERVSNLAIPSGGVGLVRKVMANNPSKGSGTDVSWRKAFICIAAAPLFGMSVTARSQINASMQVVTSATLKKLTFEELLDIEVTSVSRQPVRIAEAASAIQIVAQEDIRRAGASSIPEALRLAPNLQVAQVNASQWAISARGFSNVLANKLLVMMDGRTVYTPLYAGVFWDVQDYLMEDLERIEVISGPGGTLWGANAVNGVINIITKSAAETQGLFAEAGGGDEQKRFGGLRYGGELTPAVKYRAYVKAFERDDTVLRNGADANDDWEMAQGGFRLDWDRSAGDMVTFQGDYYDGKPNPDGTSPVLAKGGNVVGRWTRQLGQDSDFQLQGYYDRTSRDFGSGFTEQLDTYDIDWQHRFPVGTRQELIWGAGFRLLDHEVQNLSLFTFLPAHKVLHLYSAFLQDEILLAEALHLTVGSKFEHNDYTGLEVQPSVRMSWIPGKDQTIWGGVSRAVRTPARIDRDFTLRLTPTIAFLASDPEFESEDLLAYELGWRFQPYERLSLSLATFFNEYDNVRSAEPGPPPLGFPITIRNGVRGETYGAELSGVFEVTDRWRFRGGYTFLKKHLEVKPGSIDLNQATAESDDPEHQFVVQTLVDLPGNLQLDGVVRYVDMLPNPQVDSYTELDLRVGWQLMDSLELSIVGENLLHGSHAEFVPSSPSARDIERSVYGKLTWRR